MQLYLVVMAGACLQAPIAPDLILRAAVELLKLAIRLGVVRPGVYRDGADLERLLLKGSRLPPSRRSLPSAALAHNARVVVGQYGRRPSGPLDCKPEQKSAPSMGQRPQQQSPLGLPKTKFVNGGTTAEEYETEGRMPEGQDAKPSPVAP